MNDLEVHVRKPLRPIAESAAEAHREGQPHVAVGPTIFAQHDARAHDHAARAGSGGGELRGLFDLGAELGRPVPVGHHRLLGVPGVFARWVVAHRGRRDPHRRRLGTRGYGFRKQLGGGDPAFHALLFVLARPQLHEIHDVRPAQVDQGQYLQQ